MRNTYGYIRVSGREQRQDRQALALNEMGVSGEMLYMDKQSGKAVFPLRIAYA